MTIACDRFRLWKALQSYCLMSTSIHPNWMPNVNQKQELKLHNQLKNSSSKPPHRNPETPPSTEPVNRKSGAKFDTESWTENQAV